MNKEWTISKGDDGAVIYEPDTGTIASIPQDLSKWESNAQLISAAPDMYEALKELVEAIKSGYECIGGGRQTKIEQALAKAEGRV